MYVSGLEYTRVHLQVGCFLLLAHTRNDVKCTLYLAMACDLMYVGFQLFKDITNYRLGLAIIIRLFFSVEIISINAYSVQDVYVHECVRVSGHYKTSQTMTLFGFS